MAKNVCVGYVLMLWQAQLGGLFAGEQAVNRNRHSWCCEWCLSCLGCLGYVRSSRIGLAAWEMPRCSMGQSCAFTGRFLAIALEGCLSGDPAVSRSAGLQAISNSELSFKETLLLLNGR